jgi:hypothetical protein
MTEAEILRTGSALLQRLDQVERRRWAEAYVRADLKRRATPPKPRPTPTPPARKILCDVAALAVHIARSEFSGPISDLQQRVSRLEALK